MSETREGFCTVEEALAELRAGRMIVLVDDEFRENEGDLVIPAEKVTPESINFMMRNACGLVCLAMTRHRVEQLGIPLMSQSNGTRHQTAFTVSIEARDGVSTGISAHDRARTIAVAISPAAVAGILLRHLGWTGVGSFDSIQDGVLWTLRLPRVLLGALVNVRAADKPGRSPE